MTRTDTHRPSVINPDEYRFVSFHDHRPGADMANLVEQQAFRAHMDRTGGKFSDHSHGGSCHVCGAYAHTIARFHHVPTNTYVETGETCAEKLHDGDPLGFRSFRDKAKRGIEAATGKAKAQKVLENAGLVAAWEIYQSDWANDGGYQESTVRDIIGKLVRYGSISEKQTSFLASLVEQITNRAEIEARRAAEQEAAAPVPAEGRLFIEGEVLSVKVRDGCYGSTLKMLLRHVDGWKVWGTVPSKIGDVQKGNIVQFVATVTVSDDDPKFGFFKRPTKAVVVQKNES